VRLATIDVGTNTTLLLVVDVAPDGAIGILAEAAEITRLGRGIGKDGRLQPERVAATLAVLRRFAAEARRHDAAIVAVGTEALRRAPNAAELLGPAGEILGGPLEVIAGDREAALTFLAAARSFPDLAARRMVVVDIGGGSTEIVLATAGEARERISLPLGSVRLTEAFVGHDPPAAGEVAALTAHVDGLLATVPWLADGGGGVLAGIAGTVTSLAAMALGLATYDPAIVHGHRMTRAALEAQIARLATSAQVERERIVGLDPRRADVILGGAIVLERIARRLGVTEIVVSDRGIRWGVLHEWLDLGGARPPSDRG
jgi:exopolyphosphatase/guanosine-5'-triphosphate,3'-diphosphate pyrophosphatase